MSEHSAIQELRRELTCAHVFRGFSILALKSWTLENPSHPQNRTSGYLDTFTILKMEDRDLEGISDNKVSTGQAWGPELNP